MKQYLIILFFVNFIHLVRLGNYEIILEKIECLNGSGVAGIYSITELRIGKYNRTTYTLNVEFELYADIGDGYFVRFKNIHLFIYIFIV